MPLKFYAYICFYLYISLFLEIIEIYTYFQFYIMFRAILIFVFIIKFSFAWSQLIPANGSIPPGIKFKQINTPVVRVVFPQGLDSQALHVVNTINLLASGYNKSIGEKTRKINIYLVNTTPVSNGFVRLMPYHSKYFTTPPRYPFAGTVDWIELLSIHEYRHVMQFNNSLHGITALAKTLTGDIGWGLFSAGAIPQWFFEGDAVVQETALSYSGRGRLPSFKNRFDMIMDKKKPFGYEKMVCGSYKDYIPNVYSLGYQMVSYGRERFGNDIFKKVIVDATKYKGILWPFSKALKRHTGFSTKELYGEIVKAKKSPESLPSPMHFTFSSTIDKDNPVFYSTPRFLSGNEIVAVKSSFDSPPFLVKIDLNNKEKGVVEKKMFPLGSNIGQLDVCEKFIAFSEIYDHPRWEYAGYSEIFLYDLKSRKTKKLTSRKNYFFPSISPGMDQIAVVSISKDMKYQMLILDAKTGMTLKVLKNNENYLFSYPDWYDEHTLVSVATKDNKNAIVSIDIRSNELKMLLPFTTRSITYLTASDGKLFFSTSVPGNNEIESIFMLKDSFLYAGKRMPRYSFVMPAVNDTGDMVFCEKVFNNTMIRAVKYKDFFSTKKTTLNNASVDSAFMKIVEAEGGAIIDKIPRKKYNIEDYNYLAHAVKLHSWTPLYYNNTLAFLTLANDDLDRLAMSLLAQYDLDESSYDISTKIQYAGMYPVFTMGNRFVFNLPYSYRIPGDTIKITNASYHEFTATVSLPLDFTRHNWHYGAGFSVTMNAGKYFDIPVKNIIPAGYNPYFDADMRFSAFRLSAYRSLYPDFGFKFISKVRDINDGGLTGNLLLHPELYLPGLAKNHSFRFSYAFLSKDNNSRGAVLLYKSYPFARGYKKIHKGYKYINGVKFNYSLPLLYPDWALGKYAFFQRVRANLYFDADRFTKTNDNIFYKRSAGMEIIFDNVYFRVARLPLGVGVDYLFDPPQPGQSRFHFRFIIDVDIF